MGGNRHESHSAQLQDISGIDTERNQADVGRKIQRLWPRHTSILQVDGEPRH